MTPLRGRCLCGGVRFEVTEAFDRIGMCHCESCKKISGGAGTVSGRVRTEAIRILEGADLLTTYQPDEGSAKTFCSRCGTNLFGGGWPESPMTPVRLPTLDEPYEGTLEAHLFVRSVAPWESLPEDGARQYETRAPQAVSKGVLKAALRAQVEPVRDPEYAVGARRYMKSELPYLGVRTPDLRRAWRAVFVASPVTSRAQFDAELHELWDEAEFREERYTAVALLECHPEWVTLPLLERLVVEGAWWDLVDTLARRVGDLLRSDPSVATEMRVWSRDDDLWKRRVSIICQHGFKGETDLSLLYGCIEPNLGDRELFVRKAIGWALRDYAWHDPKEVDRYVRANADRLSPLSRREATKNLARLLA